MLSEQGGLLLRAQVNGREPASCQQCAVLGMAGAEGIRPRPVFSLKDTYWAYRKEKKKSK